MVWLDEAGLLVFSPPAPNKVFLGLVGSSVPKEIPKAPCAKVILFTDPGVGLVVSCHAPFVSLAKDRPFWVSPKSYFSVTTPLGFKSRMLSPELFSFEEKE